MRVLVPLVAVLALFVFCVEAGDGNGRDDDDDKDDACEMDKDEGDCNQHHIRFFFDKKDGYCRSFYYAGCRKNANNFMSRMDCYNRCDKNKRRDSDDDTNTHSCKIQMNNPFSFYQKHKTEYETMFKEALAKNLPISTCEIKILHAMEGSTILHIEIQRSFKDNSFETLMKAVQSGKFNIVVSGNIISSVPNQDPEPETHDGPWKYKKRCSEIIIGMVLFGIALIVGIVVFVKVMKKKKMPTSPMETAKNAFQTMWKSDSPDTVTMEKKEPPPEYDPTDDHHFANPTFEVQAPPAYESPAPPYSAPVPEDSYPTKDGVPA